MRVFGITGFKNSGKTSLVVDLVRQLTSRGVRIATIKHAHHEFDIDHPGKDSFLHREAGACEVLVASSVRWAHMVELKSQEEPTLDDLLAQIGDADLVLIEGYKKGGHPMLEVRRPQLGHPTLDDHPQVVAIVCDEPIDNSKRRVFKRDEIAELATFVLEHSAEI